MITLRSLGVFDLPPSHGYWPNRFPINRAWTDTLATDQWTSVPNSGGIQARRNSTLLLALRISADQHEYALTPAIYNEIDVYIAERTHP